MRRVEVLLLLPTVRAVKWGKCVVLLGSAFPFRFDERGETLCFNCPDGQENKLTISTLAVFRIAAVLRSSLCICLCMIFRFLSSCPMHGTSAGRAVLDLSGEGFVPHGWLLPRCRGIVHHGGSGTTGAALRCLEAVVDLVHCVGGSSFLSLRTSLMAEVC